MDASLSPSDASEVAGGSRFARRRGHARGGNGSQGVKISADVRRRRASAHRVGGWPRPTQSGTITMRITTVIPVRNDATVPARTVDHLIVRLLALPALGLDAQRYAERGRGPADRAPGMPWSPGARR